jgi:hypothetical protein
VHLGPGTVAVEATRVFEVGQPVEIAPGTTLVMGRDASLIFRGRLTARGTAEAPIHFVARDKRWGGIALLGPATAGSEISHFTLARGSMPEWDDGIFSGTLCVHDTRDVRVTEGRFEDDKSRDAVLHAAYVEGLALESLEIRGARGDAFDLELVQGTVRRALVVGAGQEALDLMTSRVAVSDSRFLDCGGNGISAGQDSQLDLRDTLVAGASVGVLVKSGARVRMDQVLVYRNPVGIELRLRGQVHPEPSRLEAAALFAVDCPTPTRVTDGDAAQAPAPRTLLGQADLAELRSRVLGIAGWDELEEALAVLRGGTP